MITEHSKVVPFWRCSDNEEFPTLDAARLHEVTLRELNEVEARRICTLMDLLGVLLSDYDKQKEWTPVAINEMYDDGTPPRINPSRVAHYLLTSFLGSIGVLDEQILRYCIKVVSGTNVMLFFSSTQPGVDSIVANRLGADTGITVFDLDERRVFVPDLSIITYKEVT